MINAVKQGFVASANISNSNQVSKEVRTEGTQRVENDRLSKIAQQIKNGEYKLDMGATSKAIADDFL
ncbi:flagellar biosynthesis anti-sigma factor FlgM [uncultured Campylobacter sp.]|uniref:flagellar biosynthesis anti-sigma factor FlgM n=1 Tax=uncultured Campylobacter sp. TaxID=218934 RepID=UPI0026121AAD|nr:flagellar biosynthesis anti-sigma factor FlgM [uncultured Campylobacter sp.]